MGDYSSGSSSSGSDYSSGSSSEDEEPIIIKNGSQRLVLNLNGEVCMYAIHSKDRFLALKKYDFSPTN